MSPPPDHLLQQVRVSFEYPVVFARGALFEQTEALRFAITRTSNERRHPAVFVADAGVIDAWRDLPRHVNEAAERLVDCIELRSPLLTVPAGEAGKNDPDVVERLTAEFERAHLDRHAVVVGVGGGAALDVIGFAASLVHRGLRLVRMPTTVLAQNDAGVGVKTGVNAFGAKNFLGTFAPPYAVINDARWLETLPEREIRAGLAEAVKVALIRDGRFFTWLEEHAAELSKRPTQEAPNLVLETAIRRCAELHLAHIATAGDPFETGSARPLDYGHWAAHRLEIQSGHELRHGEAVGIGMLLDARYAEQQGWLAPAHCERIRQLLVQLGLPTYHPSLSQNANGRLQVLEGLEQFREHLGGALCVTMLTSPGQAFEVSEMRTEGVEEAIRWLEAQAGATVV